MNFTQIVQDIKNSLTLSVWPYISPILVRLGIVDSAKAAVDIYIIFAFAVPVSLFLYLIFDRYKHKILVDLGHHRWIIRFK